MTPGFREAEAEAEEVKEEEEDAKSATSDVLATLANALNDLKDETSVVPQDSIIDIQSQASSQIIVDTDLLGTLIES